MDGDEKGISSPAIRLLHLASTAGAGVETAYKSEPWDFNCRIQAKRVSAKREALSAAARSTPWAWISASFTSSQTYSTLAPE